MIPYLSVLNFFLRHGVNEIAMFQLIFTKDKCKTSVKQYSDRIERLNLYIIDYQHQYRDEVEPNAPPPYSNMSLSFTII